MGFAYAPPLPPMAQARKWYIYACFLEPWPGEFYVKIGVSTDPIKRLSGFRQGLPLPPTIIWACAESRSSAYKIERKLHKIFEGRNTFGEWFRFTSEDKQVFKDATAVEYLAATGKKLEWSVTTPEQFKLYVSELAKQMKTGKIYE